jgi:hypothetical protein
MATLSTYLSDPFLFDLYSQIRKAGSLRSISLDLTSECNLRCTGCYYFEEGMVSMRNPKYNDASREFIETEYIEFPDGDKDMLDALNLAVDLVEFERMSDEPLIWVP